MARLADHTEIEFKLTVVGDDPDGLLDAIAALDCIGDDALGPAQVLRLHDVYWDTEQSALRDHGLSLRLRWSGGAAVFTAKGGAGSDDGLFRRQELELPATPEKWESVRQAVSDNGVTLGAAEATTGAPEAWLAKSGLVVTQDRVTERRTRAVLRGGKSVAELALDRTTFRLRSLEVRYREVEVEQLGNAAIDLDAVGRALTARFPGRLEPSTMGKYGRGLALERQLQSAGLL